MLALRKAKNLFLHSMKNKRFDFVLRAQLVQLYYDIGEQEYFAGKVFNGQWGIANF